MLVEGSKHYITINPGFAPCRFQPGLLSRGVTLEHSPIVEVLGTDADIEGVLLVDGRTVPIQGLYVGPRITLTSPLIEQLKLEIEETPLGSIVKVDAMKESSVKGIYAAGDLSNPMQNGTFAIASGTMAGVAVHRSLVFDA
ncbi:MAG: hypothetical protein ABJ000_18985 [Saccharospirillum sp.]|uniref:hypothetical protein n=1 Tax=Saccharospirillum sp. TaxID=2033801 RepID=UPI00329891CE